MALILTRWQTDSLWSCLLLVVLAPHHTTESKTHLKPPRWNGIPTLLGKVEKGSCPEKFKAISLRARAVPPSSKSCHKGDCSLLKATDCIQGLEKIMFIMREHPCEMFIFKADYSDRRLMLMTCDKMWALMLHVIKLFPKHSLHSSILLHYDISCL